MMKRMFLILTILALVGCGVEENDGDFDNEIADTDSDTGEPEENDAVEGTLEACQDGKDNDSDGYTDCNDQDCGIYAVCASADADADADADSDADTDADTDCAPCPFKTDGPYNLNVSTDYVLGYGDNSGCVKMVGEFIHSWEWKEGMILGDNNADGYVGMTFTNKSSLPKGMYRFSYIGAADCSISSYYWADYGVDREEMFELDEECLRFIECPNDDGCNLKIAVDDNGNITGAGNAPSL
ncbi:hypothetical protein JW899_03790 [Candidatus Uhrbacteria bacterium]|nr:hypothetical protein [Candidatus Uhrbacteria bacterium]